MNLGRHVNTSKGFASGIDLAKSQGANVVQIFIANNKTYNPKRKTVDELKNMKLKLQKENIKLVIHSNYLLNFCQPEDSDIHKKSIKNLTDDLNDCYVIGGIGCVVHMGKNTKALNQTDDVAIDNYVNGIKSVLSSVCHGTIIFETSANQGSEICYKLEDLGKLYNKFTTKEKKRITFCLDTCHMFAAGYDFCDKDKIKDIIKLIDNNLGWNNIACIHLNDSKKECGCKLDRHADLGKGCIDMICLKDFLIECNKHKIPMILETPCENDFDHKQQIDLVKTLLG
jgi:deoxyribonuclease-4